MSLTFVSENNWKFTRQNLVNIKHSLLINDNWANEDEPDILSDKTKNIVSSEYTESIFIPSNDSNKFNPNWGAGTHYSGLTYRIYGANSFPSTTYKPMFWFDQDESGGTEPNFVDEILGLWRSTDTPQMKIRIEGLKDTGKIFHTLLLSNSIEKDTYGQLPNFKIKYYKNHINVTKSITGLSIIDVELINNRGTGKGLYKYTLRKDDRYNSVEIIFNTKVKVVEKDDIELKKSQRGFQHIGGKKSKKKDLDTYGSDNSDSETETNLNSSDEDSDDSSELENANCCQGFSGILVTNELNCMLGETKLLTPKGYKCIKGLKAGDIVYNNKFEKKKIKWITYTEVNKLLPTDKVKDYRPYLFKKGSLNKYLKKKWRINTKGSKVLDNLSYPRQDLYLSGGHSIFIAGKEVLPLKLAKKNKGVCKQVDVKLPYKYYHIVLEGEHGIVIGNGVPIETLPEDNKQVKKSFKQ